jgi:D-alanyl-D-alanine carboxypeptidase/D-alanyl-D-alanine-endopeptidase (penicillin-binding protein 4)
MRLVSRAGVVTVWMILVGLPATGHTGPASRLDPVAQTAVQHYVSEVAELGLDAEYHGVWLQSEAGLLAYHQGTVPMPAASLTKVATTLAALRAWGPAYQFVTLVDTTGPIQDGILRGDLIVQGGGDPFFVTEDALALRQSLQELGLKRVTGRLIISGNFFMNFTTNPASLGSCSNRCSRHRHRLSAVNGIVWWPLRVRGSPLLVPWRWCPSVPLSTYHSCGTVLCRCVSFSSA